MPAPKAPRPAELLKEAYARLPGHVQTSQATQATYNLLIQSPENFLDCVTFCLRACNAAGLPPRVQGCPGKELFSEAFVVYKEHVGDRPVEGKEGRIAAIETWGESTCSHSPPALYNPTHNA